MESVEDDLSSLWGNQKETSNIKAWDNHNLKTPYYQDGLKVGLKVGYDDHQGGNKYQRSDNDQKSQSAFSYEDGNSSSL